MFDVILAIHTNMMTTSGTHLQGLHSTQVQRHTQIDMLRVVSVFVEHMMISTQARHHNYFDLTT